jgi:outer membrane biosynthesis protein TonB
VRDTLSADATRGAPPLRDAPADSARSAATGDTPGTIAGDAPQTGRAVTSGEAPRGLPRLGGAPQGEVSPVALAQLHARLQASADRCYPAAARRYRVGGEALLHFCSDGRGGFDSTSLARGTDSALLDTAATDCVLPGAAPLPTGLGGCFTVPVRFGVR